jgi:hypothetical protein
MSSIKWLTIRTFAVSAGVALTALSAFGDPASIALAKGGTAGQATHRTAVAPKHPMKEQASTKTASTPRHEASHQRVAHTSVAPSHVVKAPHGYDSVQFFPTEL